MLVLIGRAFNGDGHVRLTRGERFVLAGGDKETHERMQEAAIKFSEKTKGKDVFSPEEIIEKAKEAGMI